MQTQGPTSSEQVMALLFKLNKQLVAILGIEESPNKRDEAMSHSFSRLNQFALELESHVKGLVRKLDDSQKGYEQQLQKLQSKLRKHAKSQCEMRLYCEYLQEQLKTTQQINKGMQNQINRLTINYNKQIETLRTQLSNVAFTRGNQLQKIENTARNSINSIRPSDTLSKIKLRIMNLGAGLIDQPQSCANTQRKSVNCLVQEDIKPYSEPISCRNSPREIKIKQTKKKKGKIDNKSKSNSSLHKKSSEGKILSKSKLKNNKNI